MAGNDKLLKRVKKQAITEEEYLSLLAALKRSRNGGSVTKEEALLLYDWGHGARVSNATLDQVLAGKAEVNILDGELVFRQV